MKSIHYAGDTLLTGDAIANAVVHYAAALARRDSSATVDVPVRFPDGTIAHANFLLGPASQLVAVPTESKYDEIEDVELVADLLLKAERLRDPHPRTNDTEAPNASVLDDLQYPSE